jgi:DNA polymerase/3'-5' exonuclease PolX
MMNQEIAHVFEETARLLEIKGESSFRINAYRKSAYILKNLTRDISEIYKEKGLAGIRANGIGEKNTKKIEEYIKKQSIKEFDKLQQETAIQQLITYFFETKGVSLQELKDHAKKRKIVYSRFTKPAKQLLELAGSIEAAKGAIKKVADWAKSRKLDYTIETVFKKWLELESLKPKEAIKKPFYQGQPMVEKYGKRYVISKHGEWLLYAGKESEIEWRTE